MDFLVRNVGEDTILRVADIPKSALSALLANGNTGDAPMAGLLAAFRPEKVWRIISALNDLRAAAAHRIYQELRDDRFAELEKVAEEAGCPVRDFSAGEAFLQIVGNVLLRISFGA
jgi:hypothetical protein